MIWENKMEIWKPVAGYEGLYEVSNMGNVRSLDRTVKNKNGLAVKKGKVIKQAGVNSGYLRVNLWKDNMGSCFLVHRLVAEAFIGNPDNLPEVNHIDENKHNNCANNLEYCDRRYNANYGTQRQRAAEKQCGIPVGEQPILQYTTDGVFVNRFDSALKAAKAINGDNSGICKCANGKYKTSYGYIWRWENGNKEAV